MLHNSTVHYQLNMDMAEHYKFGDPDTNYGKLINKFLFKIQATTWTEQYQCNPEQYNNPSTSNNFQICNPDLKGTSSCQRNRYIRNSQYLF